MQLRNHIARLALLLATVALTMRAQDPDAPLLTLDQAIEQAVANNTTLKIAALDTIRAADELKAAKTKRYASTQVTAVGAQLLTKPSVTFPAGSLGTYAATGPIPSTDQKIEVARRPVGMLSATVLQPLSTQYRLHLQLKAEGIGLQETREDQNKTRLEIVNRVRQAYYSVVEAQSTLDSLGASLPYYEETNRLAMVNLKTETVLESDSLGANAQVLKIKNSISDAKDKVATACETLNDLMGRDVHTSLRVSNVDSADVEFETSEAMEERAIHNRPDLKKAKLQVQQADYDARAKKAEYIPEVSLAFDYATTFNFSPTMSSNITFVGMQMTWEPWDWGRRKQEYAAKRVKEEQAKVSVTATQRSVLLEVRNSWRQMQNTRRQLLLTDATERAARQKLREVQVQFKREAALSKDLFSAQSDLATADSRQQQALAAYWQARADLKKAIGEE